MILYKYRNFTETSKNRTLEIINKRELFFAGIESFNDPFDGKVHLQFHGKINEIKAAQIRTQYTMNLKKDEKFEGINLFAAKRLVDEKITSEYVNNPKERNAFLERIQKLHNSKGVLSLSSKCDNILMWSHYTFNHQGLCFGFEFSEDSFANAKRVRYQTHYEDIWGWLYTDDEIVNRILFSKAIDWQYEDEYRIIRNSIGVERFEASSLKEIVFGSQMSIHDRNQIIEECTKYNLNPTFKVASLNVERYEINIAAYPTNNCNNDSAWSLNM